MSDFQKIDSRSEGISTSTSLWNPNFVEVHPNLPDLIEVDLDDITNVGESIQIGDPDTENSGIYSTSDGQTNFGESNDQRNVANDIPNYRSPLSYYLEKMYYIGRCPYNPTLGHNKFNLASQKFRR